MPDVFWPNQVATGVSHQDDLDSSRARPWRSNAMNRSKLVWKYRFAFGITAILLLFGVTFPLMTARGNVILRVQEFLDSGDLSLTEK
jgi:hypothetical protein